ncbi:MAG: DUF4159 domain-containing protein [Acidobacteria bacterium]|nr:DUF4159 domain-containing protein [Acidobacteriota bacterium]
MTFRGACATAGLCAAGVLAGLSSGQAADPGKQPPDAEFHFLRLEYRDYYGARRGFRRGWWMQDWPEAEVHFAQGIRRLTRIHTGDGRHLGLLDPHLYDYPWIYATQTGFWDLSDEETARLREYLLRGGFLVTDDFHGPRDWERFRESMERTLPGEPILDIDNGHAMMRVLYRIEERTQIPGLRHLRRGPGGTTIVEPQAVPPHWRAMHDRKGRMVVAINFNMDIGDAWEHADMPEYPAEMTGLAYRFGINYILYAMTH